MQIQVHSLLEGARGATGTVVIIDVYRAFTTAAVAFEQGAERIILVAEVEEALRLRELGVGDLCMGEVDGRRPDGFDFGNSPEELAAAELAGACLIQSTRAGTVGAAAATRAQQLYVCSLVIARSTARAIQQQAPETVSIVAMGSGGEIRTDEDEHCALYLRNLLQGRDPDPTAVRQLVLSGLESQKFDDPDQPQYRPGDRQRALQIDACDFAIAVEREAATIAGTAVDLLVARAKQMRSEAAG